MKTNYLQLNILIVLCTISVQCNSMSIRDSITTKTLMHAVVDEKSAEKRALKECDELPPKILAELLGEAYNSRYMSIKWPMDNDAGENERNVYSVMKRKVESVPSFYVDEKHTIELSEKPAWDVKGHVTELEAQRAKRRRKKRSPISATRDNGPKLQDNDSTSTEIEHQIQDYTALFGTETHSNAFNETDDEQTTARNKRAYSRSSSSQSDNKKLYPWKCDAKIKWVDLGPDYFPRFLRTVECTKHYCWYKAFVCKPKSFAVKILHRRKGKCADAGNLKRISSFDFHGEFGEVWKWEEVAINFCCDCAIA